MEEFYFEKLEVYRRARIFAIKICKIAAKFPFQFSRVRDQLIGASISPSLNIAEGSGRASAKDRNNFFKIARTSIFECIPILDICLSLDLISRNTYDELRQETIELSKMLNGLMKFNAKNQ